MKNSIIIALRAGVAPLVLGFAIASAPAFAQDTTAQDATADEPEGAIIVTGSRIQTAVPTTVAPVQVIGENLLESSGAINVQETLLKNPVFGVPTFSRTANAFNTSSAGAATVDLRNLGIDRTLVLIDGRRVVSGIPGSSAVDLNMIPTQMLERVEVLTSGSGSAIYGSDAVAGVVNFILKDDFEGIELNAQSGISEEGDNFTLDTGVLMGGNFADGRGNATVFFGYSQQGAVYKRDHRTEWGSSAIDSLSAIFSGGNIFEGDVPVFSGYSPQGTYFTDNYAWTYGPNNGPLQPCTATNVATCTTDIGSGVGPTGFNRSQYRYLAVPVERYLLNFNSHYDINDSMTAFLQGSFQSSNARTTIEPFPWDTDSSTKQYFNGQMPIETLFEGAIVRNPFVPDAIFNDASDTDGDGLRDIFVSKRTTDLGNRTTESTQDTFRIVGGLKGEIAPNWNFEAFANYGQSDVSQTGSGQINVVNFRASQQIIPDPAGGFMCADPSARANGCVPANIFGPNSFSPGAVEYLEAPSSYNATQKQTQIGANVTGSIDSFWGADAIGLTVGTEYRRESQRAQWDALTTAGLNGGNALGPTRGSFDLYEFYGETLLPIISNGFVDDLSVRGAVRYSHYSTIGDTFSWNVGGELAPIEDIRFRVMYAETVRAPNIAELFQGLSQDFPTVNDPCDGIGLTGGGALGDNCRAAPGVIENINANGGAFNVSQTDRQGVTSFSGGNPDLKEEKGKTFTAGVVINPRSIDALRNLTITIDYFDVEVKDAIVLTPEQFIVDQCYRQGTQSFCELITRRPTELGINSAGSLNEIFTSNSNSGGIKTSGIDVTVGYTHTFAMGENPLNTGIQFAYTHLFNGWTKPRPNEDKDVFAGEVGAATDRFTVNTNVGTDAWKLSLTGTYIGPSWIDDQFDGPKVYKVHDEFYLDGQVRFYVADNMEMYVGMDNILDNNPVYFASVNGSTTGQDSDVATYDPFGRRFYAGAKVKF